MILEAPRISQFDRENLVSREFSPLMGDGEECGNEKKIGPYNWLWKIDESITSNSFKRCTRGMKRNLSTSTVNGGCHVYCSMEMKENSYA